MCFFQAENATKPFRSGTSPKIPLGELTAFHPTGEGDNTPNSTSTPKASRCRRDFGASLLDTPIPIPGYANAAQINNSGITPLYEAYKKYEN